MHIQYIYLNFPHFVQDDQPRFHIQLALKNDSVVSKSNNIIYRVFCICLIFNNKLTDKKDKYYDGAGKQY